MAPPILGLMIPIIAIVMGIGIGMLRLFLNYRKRTEMFAFYHQERMAAIEKGIDLPPLPDAFFDDNCNIFRLRSPHRHLLAGLVLLFVGLTLTLALYVEQPHNYLWGLIPASIGLAFLIYYFAVGKKEAEAMEAAAKAKAAQTSRPPTP